MRCMGEIKKEINETELTRAKVLISAQRSTLKD